MSATHAPERLRLLFPLAGVLLMAACATPLPPSRADTDTWNGRLALQVEDAPSQSLTAAFTLQGSAHAGELRLFNPLGQVLASLIWSAAGAVLTQGAQQRTSPTLAALLRDLTGGTTLPIDALFAWLHGNAIEAEGWHADLSALPQGRLTAQRKQPQPRVTLRVVLD